MSIKYSTKEKRGLVLLAGVLVIVLAVTAIVGARGRRAPAENSSADGHAATVPDTLIIQHPDTMKLDAVRQKCQRRATKARNRTSREEPRRSPLDEPVPRMRPDDAR